MDIIHSYTKDHFLTQNFKKAIAYTKPFHFDLYKVSQKNAESLAQHMNDPNSYFR